MRGLSIKISTRKLGVFGGVVIPSCEAILGAVLFLVLPSLVHMVGLWQMLFIVLLANSATIATAFSISSTVTNLREVSAGGMYVVSKDSVGRAFGGSIGIQLYLAQAASIGFYCIGFATSVGGMIADFIPIENLSILRLRQLIATLLVLCVAVVALVNADFINKLQKIIFVILGISVAVVICAPYFSPTIEGRSIYRASAALLRNPAVSMIGFWGAFTIFFPAVTGIDAGVGMSGSLRNARRALPLGTFLAIGITLIIYIVAAISFSFIDPQLLAARDGVIPAITSLFVDNPVLLTILCVGIIVATISSAFSYFLTAPITLQTIAKDGMLPKRLGFLRNDFYKKGTQPRWAILVTLVIALAIIWSGDISIASQAVGILFLMVYSWMNLAAFLERISNNPSFRPTFRSHWLVSLYGCILCIVGIVLFNPYIGLCVLIFQIVVMELLLRYRTNHRLEGIWWGFLFTIISWVFKKLTAITQGTKNWRPVVGAFVFPDDADMKKQNNEMVRRIGNYKGLTVTHEIAGDNADEFVYSVATASMIGGITLNTVLLPVTPALDIMKNVIALNRAGKHVILYKHHSLPTRIEPHIDIWWKGQSNGTLMALLAFIIDAGDKAAGAAPQEIRLFQKLNANDIKYENDQSKEMERNTRTLETLLDTVRLEAKAYVLEYDAAPIQETISRESHDASLVIVGIPGPNDAAMLDEMAQWKFVQTIGQYGKMPPMLFVRAAYQIELD